jgi:hypothetical protein
MTTTIEPNIIEKDKWRGFGQSIRGKESFSIIVESMIT